MRDCAVSGSTALRSSAVNTPTTPGDRRAASASILAMRACAWSLRRSATCTIRRGCRSSTNVPCPVSSLGSSTRFTRAPTSFGLVIAVPALLELLPLGLVVAADDGGAASLDAADLLEGAVEVLRTPGVVRQNVAIVVGAHAVRIGG